jgi:hypothetical protein
MIIRITFYILANHYYLVYCQASLIWCLVPETVVRCTHVSYFCTMVHCLERWKPRWTPIKMRMFMIVALLSAHQTDGKWFVTFALSAVWALGGNHWTQASGAIWNDRNWNGSVQPPERCSETRWESRHIWKYSVVCVWSSHMGQWQNLEQKV